jgi:2-polyprenyl-3-methyl-5-hydroxy-6-metoxy-1,4-benzoquinol methylase
MKNPYSLDLSQNTVHNLFIQYTGNSQNILDVGCNDGYIGSNDAKANSYYGLDYRPEGIELAKKYYKDAIVYDLNNLIPLPWQIKFDVMIFGDVLEHVLFPEQVLKYFVDNYLDDKGTVLLSLPNIANYRIRVNLLLGKFDYTDRGIMDRTHLHLYTFKTGRELSQQCELEVIAEHGVSQVFGPLMRTLPFTKPLLSKQVFLICKKKNTH